MRNRFIASLIVIATVAACGRREKRAFFDSTPLPAPVRKSVGPLPAAAMSVRWGEIRVPRELAAGRPAFLSVTFTNTGSAPWPDNAAADPDTRDGRYAVRLNHSWVASGEPIDGRTNGGRTNLPHSIAPGESATVELEIRAPDKPGEYQLVIELLQEMVVWFSNQGADRFIAPVRVVPAGAAAAPSHTP